MLAFADGIAGACALVLVGLLYPAHSVLDPESVAVLPVLIVLARLLGLYHKDEKRLGQSTLDETPVLLQLAAFYAVAIWIVQQFAGRAVSGTQEVSLLIWFLIAALALRILARTLARSVIPAQRCLIVGDAQTAERLGRALDVAGSGARIVHARVASAPQEESARFRELADPMRLAPIVKDSQVERLILAPRHPNKPHVPELVHTAKSLGLRVTLLPFLGELIGHSAELESVGGVTVLGLPRYALSRSALLSKRVLDLLGASLMLVAAAPVLLIVAIAIRLDSRGPVLFRQLRMGRGDRRFEILKFRSMVDEAEGQKLGLLTEEHAAGLFKLEHDPRVTRVGRLLRRTSLDELPQLWNVLCGDMSLVGPRPLVIDEDAKVHGAFRQRLNIKPGMTGPWQVLRSARVPLDDMIRIDYLYVANWSLWLDIKILLRTVPHVLFQRGL